MWKIYVGAVEWVAIQIAPHGVQWILDPRQCRRAALAAAVGLGIAVSPLIVPAQMTPQERRQFERHEQRLQVLERDNALIRADLNRLQELPKGQELIQRELVGIKTLISERDKALSWTITLLNAGALLAAGVWFLIRHRRPQS